MAGCCSERRSASNVLQTELFPEQRREEQRLYAHYTWGRTGSPGPDPDPSSAPALGRGGGGGTQPGAGVAFSDGGTLMGRGRGDRPMGSKGPALASGPQRRPERQERPSP